MESSSQTLHLNQLPSDVLQVIFVIFVIFRGPPTSLKGQAPPKCSPEKHEVLKDFPETCLPEAASILQMRAGLSSLCQLPLCARSPQVALSAPPDSLGEGFLGHGNGELQQLLGQGNEESSLPLDTCLGNAAGSEEDGLGPLWGAAQGTRGVGLSSWGNWWS